MNRQNMKREVKTLHEQINGLIDPLSPKNTPDILEDHDFLAREFISGRYLDNLQQHWIELVDLKNNLELLDIKEW